MRCVQTFATRSPEVSQSCLLGTCLPRNCLTLTEKPSIPDRCSSGYELIERGQPVINLTMSPSSASHCPSRCLVQRSAGLTSFYASNRLECGPCYADALSVTPCSNALDECALHSTEDQQIDYHERVDEHEWYCS